MAGGSGEPEKGSGVCIEDGIDQFEEGVASAVETFVQRAVETVESIGRFHDAPIMHWPTALRTPYLPVGENVSLAASFWEQRLDKSAQTHMYC